MFSIGVIYPPLRTDKIHANENTISAIHLAEIMNKVLYCKSILESDCKD